MIQDAGAVTAQCFPAPFSPGPGDMSSENWEKKMAVVRISFANNHSWRLKNDVCESFANPTFIFHGGLMVKSFAKSFAKRNFELRKKNFQGVSCWQFKILTWTFRTTPTWEIHGNTMEYDITWQCNELEILGKWLNHWFWGICAHVGTNPWQTNMSHQHLETSLSLGTLYCSFETFLLWLRIPRATMHPGL